MLSAVQKKDEPVTSSSTSVVRTLTLISFFDFIACEQAFLHVVFVHVAHCRAAIYEPARIIKERLL